MPSLCSSNDCSSTDTKAKGTLNNDREYPITADAESTNMSPRFPPLSSTSLFGHWAASMQGYNLILTADASQDTAQHTLRCLTPTCNPLSIQPFIYSTLFKDKVSTIPGYFFFEFTGIFSIEFNTKIQSIWRSSLKKIKIKTNYISHYNQSCIVICND